MASGGTVTTFYNGPTAAASGDTFLTFPMTLTELGGTAMRRSIEPPEYLFRRRWPVVRALDFNNIPPTPPTGVVEYPIIDGGFFPR